jgi:hypothetical protein
MVGLCDDHPGPLPPGRRALSDRPPGPIQGSYWVVPGRLLAGEYPGAADEEFARAKLNRLRDAGIDLFLDLTEEGEYGLAPYEPLLAGLAYVRLAVRDLACPTVDEMVHILDAIDAAIAARQTPYVHCYAGVGRTGTVVGCYLVRHGLPAQDALSSIAAWRRGTPNRGRTSPETQAQRDMVLGWASGK